MDDLFISDDVLGPDEKILIIFKGQNPMNILKIIKAEIKSIYQIPGKDIKTLKLNWDASSDNREIYAQWLIEKKMDKWSKNWVIFIVQGHVDAKTNKGDITFIMVPRIQTKINYSNFLQRAFWYIYNRWFYRKQRMKYIEEAKDLAFKFRDKITDELGIPRKMYFEDRV
ncbi:MAG: hypothetical protein J7J92_03830 [Candidatus Aenigmarchaeota archaeon]|nr:hypothetical protein [Candidatus Aenigmarchaeota archaeon]